MNTIEYIRFRGWDENEVKEKLFYSSKGKSVTILFMMEAYADYKVEQALRIHDIARQREQLIDFGIWLDKNDKHLENGNIFETVQEYLKDQLNILGSV